MKRFDDYMASIRSAASRHCIDGIYRGRDGAKQFARECGYALPDFSSDEREIQEMISKSYSGICVIAYALKPPINAKEWANAMRDGAMSELERRKNR